ncbi:c-type cytochrome [Flavobacterium saliperosum]|uniref:Nitric oxide reductase subunit C n=2 Tax=Flavobacterium saliperosum TaxID=329186 RepID=A0A1G4V3N6_9FLAO|nr:cytochrome c [Flavobacterium saliperosum]SCX00704.1 nitric oxide reductase subunit C [Flavobacterium saliperosum]
MIHKKTKIYIGCMLALVSVFSFYNFTIYTNSDAQYETPLSDKALHGQELWQRNNCFSCHQLYGLGGYLGPDLTNVFSAENKGPEYIKAFLNSGIKTMPKFHFSEAEKEAIVTFLKEVDASGYYPNYNATIQSDGWVDIEYKDAK